MGWRNRRQRATARGDLSVAGGGARGPALGGGGGGRAGPVAPRDGSRLARGFPLQSARGTDAASGALQPAVSRPFWLPFHIRVFPLIEGKFRKDTDSYGFMIGSSTVTVSLDG
jgi:hypothetical protein